MSVKEHVVRTLEIVSWYALQFLHSGQDAEMYRTSVHSSFIELYVYRISISL